MADNSGNSGGDIFSFAGLLTLLFIGLKLTHFIDWSWWWVWSPIPFAFLIWVIFAVTIVTIAVLLDETWKRK